jgi:hypothetical protein
LRTRLTRRSWDAAWAKGRDRSIVWDGDLRGFGLRVLPSGTKTFVAFYRNEAGEKRLISIGRFGEPTADEARPQARKILVDAVRGEDPAGSAASSAITSSASRASSTPEESSTGARTACTSCAARCSASRAGAPETSPARPPDLPKRRCFISLVHG